MNHVCKGIISFTLAFAMSAVQIVPLNAQNHSRQSQKVKTDGLIQDTTIDIHNAEITYSDKEGYISELRTVIDSDAAKAMKKLRQAGYEVLNQDLNADSDYFSTKKSVYLGYKTTSDSTQALRDVITLGQLDDYIILEYDEIMNEQYKELADMEDDYIAMIEEFRENYHNDSSMALAGHKLLNIYQEDDSQSLVGDWLMNVSLEQSTAESISPLMDVFAQVSQAALSEITYSLAIGLSTCQTNNFLDRIQSLTSSDIRKAQSDASLYDKAALLKENLQNFSSEAQKIQEYKTALSGVNPDHYTAEQSYYAGEVDFWDQLEEITYDNTGLGTFLTSSPSLKKLYPIVSVMSDAQVKMVSYAGLKIVLTLEQTDIFELSDGTDDVISELADVLIDVQTENIKKEYGVDGVISIYYGVDREPFTGKIAVTKEAVDEAASTGDYSMLASNDDTSFAELVMVFGSIATFAGTVITLAKTYDHFIAARHYDRVSDVVGELFWNGNESNIELWDKLNESLDLLDKHKKLTKIYGIVAVTLGIVFMIINIWTAYEVWRDQHPKYDIESIPRSVFHKKVNSDTGESYYVRYRCVTDLSDNPSDVNGYVGKAWNVLYSTKEVDAGMPLRAQIVSVSTKDGSGLDEIPDDYIGIHKSGYTVATNLNESVFEAEAPKIYIFIRQVVKKNATGSVLSKANNPLATGMIGFILGWAAFIIYLVHKRKKYDEKS